MDVDVDYAELESLIHRDHNFMISVMAKIGAQGRKALQRRYLSSRGRHSVKFEGFGKNKRGSYKVRNRVTKRGHVVFTAPALNPHEHGRTYKGTGVDESPYARKRHITDPAKKVLTVRFRDYLRMVLNRLARSAVGRALKERAK